MVHILYEANAFTADGKNGNPAGIVLGTRDLNDQEMLATARQAGFSETVFVRKSATATYELRFFTPTTEIDLCGHATIASWSLMYQRGLVSVGDYTQQTHAGLLGVTITDSGLVFMEQTKAEFYEEVSPFLIASLLGITEGDFDHVLKPQIVSTGIRDLLVPVKDKSVLGRLGVELDAIATFSRQRGISGLHIFAVLPNSESVASASNFAPADGIDEEAATGTSSGALLCYLKKNDRLPDQVIYRIEQGEGMGRLSYIYGKFVREIVWVGGAATIIGESEIIL